MGRKAKLRKERNPKVIHLVGEQAEAFDLQMDVDREWFENSNQTFFFRPEIEGEFDEYKIAGSEPPHVHAVVQTPVGIGEIELGWVCVVDMGRYCSGGGPASGWRLRVRTSAPLQADIRAHLIGGVKQHADRFINFAVADKADLSPFIATASRHKFTARKPAP